MAAVFRKEEIASTRLKVRSKINEKILFRFYRTFRRIFVEKSFIRNDTASTNKHTVVSFLKEPLSHPYPLLNGYPIQSIGVFEFGNLGLNKTVE